MSGEGVNPEKYTIFGDSDFALETDDVAKDRERVIESARLAALHQDSPDMLRRAAIRQGEDKLRSQVAFYAEHDDAAVLEIAHQIFERGRVLEGSGISALDIGILIEQEFPDYMNLYGLISKNRWGEEITQTILAVALSRGKAE
jgi:hypothetical protein